ncbi:hypothetical protein [Bacillus cereus group sp. BfR-BA-02730]|uniref:hypothetical protein n=1 Tax=Bacillus cereus group sp. BfR-BA-02730 TaxID=3094893 RepID=UPI0029C22464|nr:hypothetical protein [Bacillus cereus group sp. BfR-BA-02730]MDX5808582.1 hypothetical protein [Bacillus cereus group sp. BfR-BA-02730]
MKNMLKKIKNSKGYVSIETIIVAGLIIGLGVATVILFQNKGNTVTDKAMTNIDTATNQYKVVDPNKGTN